MNKVLKIIKYIFIVLLGMVCFINVISITSIYVFNKDYPNIFGYSYFEVRTGSMRNAIKEQDIVVVKIDDEYEKGDIITYKSNDSYITHRIVNIDDKKIITKGDANNLEDDPIELDQVVGRVVWIIPELGIILRVITDKTTIILLFMFIILLSYMSSIKERE